MTPRENMLNLYRRQGYEFAPVELNMCPTLREKMEKAIGKGVAPETYFSYEKGFARGYVPNCKLKPRNEPNWRTLFSQQLDADTSFDPYGVAMEGGAAATFHMRRMHHPLANATSLDEIKSHPWPEWDFDNIAHMAQGAKNAHTKDLPAFAYMACTVWETSWYIRDMTMLMADMADEDEKATFILDRVTENSAQSAAAYARAGADVICMGDDIGMQRTGMMSLEMYRTWLKPRLTKVISAAKQENPKVLIHYHSCGFVEPYIPDLIEAGIDILNPVQPECMDFGKLLAEYGDKLAFNGTLGTQTTMPFGTPEEVRKTTIRNLDLAGSKGGLLACPTHLLEPEVPWENVAAYVMACKEYSTAGR